MQSPFASLRSGPKAASWPSRQKQIPSSRAPKGAAIMAAIRLGAPFGHRAKGTAVVCARVHASSILPSRMSALNSSSG